MSVLKVCSFLCSFICYFHVMLHALIPLYNFYCEMLVISLADEVKHILLDKMTDDLISFFSYMTTSNYFTSSVNEINNTRNI